MAGNDPDVRDNDTVVRDDDPVVEVVGVTRLFAGADKPALDGVTLAFRRRECVVLSGANGSGKSVLMHLIAGLDRPTSGSVRVSRGADGKAARVGLVFQDASAQILGDTVLEDAEYGPKNLGLPPREASGRARDALSRAGLAGKEGFPARTLSGGEKRRLAVAGILAMDAEIIILDEPYANLDWPGVVQVNEVIASLIADGKTVIVLTHELEKVLALAGRLVVLHSGRVAFDGAPDEALLSAPLESWGIRNPLGSYASASDLVWAGDAAGRHGR